MSFKSSRLSVINFLDTLRRLNNRFPHYNNWDMIKLITWFDINYSIDD